MLKEEVPKVNQKLFNPILMRIQRVLKYNYMEEFYIAKKVELINIPIS